MSKDVLMGSSDGASTSSTVLPGRTQSAEPARTRAKAAAAADAEAGLANGAAADHAEEGKGRNEHPRTAYLRSLSWLRSILLLAGMHVVGIAILYLLYSRLPSLGSLNDKLSAAATAAAAADGSGGGGAAAGEAVAQAAALRLALPRNFEELHAVRRTLELYRRHYAGEVLTLLVAAYMYLQTFMIPGSIAINILCGSMYPFWWAMGFTAIMATLGATSNYLLARWLFKGIVTGLFPARVQGFSQELKKHQAHLLNYMLFLRCTPLLPAWFINLASPCIGVPLHTFVIATVVGHQPINFITVQAGKSVGSMKSFHDLYSPSNVAFLLVVGSLALVPIALKRRAQLPERHGLAPVPQRKLLTIRQGLAPLLPLAAVTLPGGGMGGGKANGSSGALAAVPEEAHES